MINIFRVFYFTNTLPYIVFSKHFMFSKKIEIKNLSLHKKDSFISITYKRN